MFRSGAHELAIEFLTRKDNVEEVRRFGELYKEYFVDHAQSIPRDLSLKFYNSFTNSKEMYRDALISLMIGSIYHPVNE